MTITRDNGRRVFALEVGGLIYRYNSGTTPSGLSSIITTGINYVDVEGIISVSAFSASIDPSGGIGQYEPITVTLGINKRGGDSDPGVVFGRCGLRSAPTKAQVTRNVTRTDSTIRVDTPLTSLSYPRLLHIGAETIRATAAISVNIFCSGGRSVGNTTRQAHSVRLEGSFVPEVTTEITTFRGRRAKLYMAHKYADGTVSAPWVEIMNGFIESSPIVEQGDSISLSIVPLTAYIDTSLADKGLLQTKLLHNYHYFGRRGSVLEYAMQLDGGSNNKIRYGIDYSGTVTANTLSVIGDKSTLVEDFDVNLPTGLDTNNEWLEPLPHPRYPMIGTFNGFGENGFPTSIATSSTSSGQRTYDIALNAFSDAAQGSDYTASFSVVISPLVEVKQQTLSGLQQWPKIINDDMIANGPSTVSGASGGVVTWRLTEDNKILASKLSASGTNARLYFWTDFAAFSDANLDGAWWRCRYWDGANAQSVLDSRYRLWYPIDLGKEDQPFFEDWRRLPSPVPGVVKTITVQATQPTNSEQLRDVAKAYFQIFEDRILVENSLGISSTFVSFDEHEDVIVRYTDRTTGEQREQVFEVTHESTATFDGVDVGKYLHLNPNQDFRDNISFGDWSNIDRAIIFRGGSITNERPGTALLKLLQSGGGGQINGSYDVMGVGCNLKSDDIDEDSFLSVDAASPFTLNDYFVGDGQDIQSIVTSILKLLGAAIVMKRDETTGRSKITLVAVGAERAANTAATIEAGDWLVDPAPHWDNYEDIVTQIKYQYDFDAGEEKFLSETLFNNQEAINRYGGELTQIAIELPGVSSSQFGRGAGDIFQEFLPTSQRLFNLLSNPLRVWRGAIGTGPSTFLDVGSYVKVSSPHLRGYGDTYGVVDGVGMIRTIHQELMNEGCEVEILTTGLTPVAWNATAKVDTIPTTTTVTVTEDDFSGSSVDDVSFFQAGDVVDYLPLGDHDNAITGLTIQSISSNTITFTGSHGISASGGTLEPTTYANASATHQQDAYLANASNVINSNVDAQEYS